MGENKNKCDNVIFIRHRFGENEIELCEKLYDEKKIAYHHKNETFENEKKEEDLYIGTKIFMELERNSEDYIIITEYNCNNRILVGKIIQNAKVENLEYKIENKKKNKIEINVYKTLLLSDTCEFEAQDLPIYLAIRPQQGTCCYPKTAFMTRVLPLIYNYELLGKGKITVSTELFHDKAIEQMCEEYLRCCEDEEIGAKLAYSSCRVGKTMKDYDIVGRLEDNREIFAQVKSDNVSKYKKLFEDIEPEDNKVFVVFADSKENSNPKFNNKKLDIKFISIKKVFEYFIKNNQQMLIDMMGFPEKYKDLIKFD